MIENLCKVEIMDGSEAHARLSFRVSGQSNVARGCAFCSVEGCDFRATTEISLTNEAGMTEVRGDMDGDDYFPHHWRQTSSMGACSREKEKVLESK